MTNAYAQTQTSGISWPVANSGRAYWRFQETPKCIARAQEFEILADGERQMAQFEAQYEATLRELARYYVMPDDCSVQSFLRSHRTIPQLLAEAASHLKQCFGSDTIFALRAPSDESGSQTLRGIVMWPGDVNEVRTLLGRFDDDWWIAHSGEASGYLSFNFELV